MLCFGDVVVGIFNEVFDCIGIEMFMVMVLLVVVCEIKGGL